MMIFFEYSDRIFENENTLLSKGLGVKEKVNLDTAILEIDQIAERYSVESPNNQGDLGGSRLY
jgi:hypothetical protein